MQAGLFILSRANYKKFNDNNVHVSYKQHVDVTTRWHCATIRDPLYRQRGQQHTTFNLDETALLVTFLSWLDTESASITAAAEFFFRLAAAAAENPFD